MARCLLKSMGMPAMFWGEAATPGRRKERLRQQHRWSRVHLLRLLLLMMGG